MDDLRQRLGMHLEEMTQTLMSRSGCDSLNQGEWMERIASVSRYAISTMKNMISNYHLYFEVCQRNGIVPEACSNV